LEREVSRFSVSENILTLPSFAKINLSLRVLGRRPDGYHEISTIFQTVTLHDHLTFQSLSDDRIELTCDDEDIPVDQRNLVWQAAVALRANAGIHAGAQINLRKRIPAGGGLGGGSSNAAVTLLGLAHLWKIRTSREELANLGALLGADVPFFLTGGTARGTGTGIDIHPLTDEPEQPLLIVTPKVFVSTSSSYGALNAPALTKADGVANLPISHESPDFSVSLREELFNDFEPVAFRLHPEIRQAKEALLDSGARRALLSGSGASVFGIFDSREHSVRAGGVLSGMTNWRVFSCTTLSRAKYVAALSSCEQLS